MQSINEKMDSEKVDFVVTWVDEKDKKWLDSKKKYSNNYDMNLNSEARYRDWDFLKYWFRSVERNAPWVNKLFFVTEGHIPEWLNTKYEKLVIVNHNQFIDKKYLPTFNSNVIELNFANIKDLSNNFVSFNDDMFLNDKVLKEDFFKGNLPRDIGVFSPILPKTNTIDATVLNNVEIINNHFSKDEVLKKNFFKYFNVRYGKHLIKNFCVMPWKIFLGFYDNHIPISYNKSTFKKVWKLEESRLTSTLENRFRTSSDVSHWLMRYWQICEGDFVPRTEKFGKYYNVGIDNDVIINDIKKSKHKVICLNDSNQLKNFEESKKIINSEFRRKYGKKSKFEK